jgi:hypothetical protein
LLPQVSNTYSISLWVRISPTAVGFRQQVLSFNNGPSRPLGFAVTPITLGASCYYLNNYENYVYDVPHNFPAGEW